MKTPLTAALRQRLLRLNPLNTQVMMRQVAIGLVCVTVLLAVSSMYVQPEFLMTLADQVWGCF
jgi:hypothetical protein